MLKQRFLWRTLRQPFWHLSTRYCVNCKSVEIQGTDTVVDRMGLCGSWTFFHLAIKVNLIIVGNPILGGWRIRLVRPKWSTFYNSCRWLDRNATNNVFFVIFVILSERNPKIPFNLKLLWIRFNLEISEIFMKERWIPDPKPWSDSRRLR